MEEALSPELKKLLDPPASLLSSAGSDIIIDDPKYRTAWDLLQRSRLADPNADDETNRRLLAVITKRQNKIARYSERKNKSSDSTSNDAEATLIDHRSYRPLSLTHFQLAWSLLVLLWPDFCSIFRLDSNSEVLQSYCLQMIGACLFPLKIYLNARLTDGLQQILFDYGRDGQVSSSQNMLWTGIQLILVMIAIELTEDYRSVNSMKSKTIQAELYDIVADGSSGKN